MVTTEQAAAWFEWRAKNTPMPATRAMFEIAAAALREKAANEKERDFVVSQCQQNENQY